MPEKNAISTIAHTTASVPVGVAGMFVLGIQISDWAIIGAVASALFAVLSYCVRMWRDIQIGKAAKGQRVTVSSDE